MLLEDPGGQAVQLVLLEENWKPSLHLVIDVALQMAFKGHETQAI